MSPAGNEETRAARELFIDIDDAAVDLEQAIARAQDGVPSAADLAAIGDRIKSMVAERGTLNGADALIDAADDAVTASEGGDVRRLVEAGVAAGEARQSLAESIIGG